MRRSLVALGAIVALSMTLMAVNYGTVAWDAWRFSEDIATRHRFVDGPGGRGAQISMTCNHCHGENGNSRSDAYPALSGLPASYLTAQLKDFASGRRGSPHMRPLALYLSPADIEAISIHYAKQTVDLSGRESANVPVTAVAGHLQACVACHGAALQGGVAPRLAGQGAIYLQRQLEAFRAGARVDTDGTMAAVAKALNPAELEDIAKAASALRPVAP